MVICPIFPAAAPAVEKIEEWARGPEVGAFPDLSVKGFPRPTLRNTRVALEQLGVGCSFDRFKLKHYIAGSEVGEFSGEFADASIHRLRELVMEKFRFDPSKENIKDVGARSGAWRYERKDVE